MTEDNKKTVFITCFGHMDKPLEGSVHQICTGCWDPIWASPAAMNVTKNPPEGYIAKLICYDCMPSGEEIVGAIMPTGDIVPIEDLREEELTSEEEELLLEDIVDDDPEVIN